MRMSDAHKAREAIDCLEAELDLANEMIDTLVNEKEALKNEIEELRDELAEMRKGE